MFSAAEVRLIRSMASMLLDGDCPEGEAEIAESILEKTKEHGVRALLLAKQALQDGHWNVTASVNPGVGDSAFAEALSAVNAELGFPDDRVVGDDWLLAEAAAACPRLRS